MDTDFPKDFTVPSDWAGDVARCEYIIVMGLVADKNSTTVLGTLYDNVDEVLKVIDGLTADGTRWAMFKWREIRLSVDEWK